MGDEGWEEEEGQLFLPPSLFSSASSSGQSCSGSGVHAARDPSPSHPLTQTFPLSLYLRGGGSSLLLLISRLIKVSRLRSQPLLSFVLTTQWFLFSWIDRHPHREWQQFSCIDSCCGFRVSQKTSSSSNRPHLSAQPYLETGS